MILFSHRFLSLALSLLFARRGGQGRRAEARQEQEEAEEEGRVELDPKVQVAAGGARRGRVPQVPIQRSQLGVDRGRAVALPAAALLHGHRIGGQVQVPRHRRLPRDARRVRHAPRDALEGHRMIERASVLWRTAYCACFNFVR